MTAVAVRPQPGAQTIGIVLVLASTLLEAAVIGWWAWHRGVNADEGFYLAAATHVAEHRRLYADVFCPQMPYMPWLLGGMFRLVPPSLGAGRLVSVAAASLSAGLLTALVWLQERRVDVTALAALLFIANAVTVDSLAVIKTAALVNVALLAAFAPIALGKARQPLWACFAGVASGCAIGVRSPVAPVAAVFALLVLREGVLPFLAFVVGGLLASVPWLAVAARVPDQFWFCNVTFHSLRREISGLHAIVAQKIGIIAKWVLLPQNALVWALIAYGLYSDRKRVWPAALVVTVSAVAYAAATPTYLEYLGQFFGFAVLAAVPGIAALARRRRLALAVAALYLIGCYGLIKHAPTGTRVAGNRALWARATVDQVAGYIRQHSAPDDRVLSWWEGYPVLSGQPGYAGVGFWESNVARKIDAAAAQRYHVVQRDQLAQLVADAGPAWVVVDDGTWTTLRGQIEARYEPVHRVGAIQIYQRRSAVPSAASEGVRQRTS